MFLNLSTVEPLGLVAFTFPGPIYDDCDLVVRLHQHLTLQTTTATAELHALVIRAGQRVRSLHVVGGPYATRRAVTMLAAVALPIPVSWDDAVALGVAPAPARHGPLSDLDTPSPAEPPLTASRTG